MKIGKNEWIILDSLGKRSIMGNVAFNNLSKRTGIPKSSLKKSMKSLKRKRLVNIVKKKDSTLYMLTLKGMEYV